MLKRFVCLLFFLCSVSLVPAEEVVDIELLVEKAETGDAEAMYELARCYRWGHGVEHDMDKAIEWFKKSAEKDYQWAYFQLGRLHARDKPERTNQLYAFDCFKKALGVNARSYYRLAYCYQYYEEVTSDMDKALELYQKASELGDPAADCMLGDWYAAGTHVAKNLKKAEEFYQKALTRDVPRYWYEVGQRYLCGRQVLKDPVQAIAIFERAAERGYLLALTNLAGIYRQGEYGTPVNQEKAAELYQKAAQRGNGDAQAALGEMYALGQGVEKDFAKAKHWVQQAFYNNSGQARNLWSKYSLWNY
jgi:TPR repeat protein